MRKERLIRLDLEIILDTALDEYISEVDYAITNNYEVWFSSFKDYFISWLEHYLDMAKIVVIENTPFVERFVIKNEQDIKRFIDDDFIDWDWLEELSLRYLEDLGYSRKKVKEFLNPV